MAVTTSPSLPELVRQRLVTKYARRITAEGELLISSQRFRDAGRNAADCLEKLRQWIADAARHVPARRPTRPHAGIGATADRRQAAARGKEAATGFAAER